MSERLEQTPRPLEWRDLSEEGITQLEQQFKKNLPDLQVVRAKWLTTGDKWVRRLESGEIKAHLGYEKGKIIIPNCPTTSFYCDHIHLRLASGNITIDEIQVKTVGMLTEEDASSMGFDNLKKMRLAMWRSFGVIGLDEIVTIMKIASSEINWHNG